MKSDMQRVVDLIRAFRSRGYISDCVKYVLTWSDDMQIDEFICVGLHNEIS